METERINRIKVVLVEQNRTGKWLAEQLQKNEATISRWCSNTSQPSLEMLVKIAKILDVDVRKLINPNNNEERYGE
ncbi:MULTISPECIES: helix-turn-helix transcriptional regulator [Bacteroidales]|uniref:Helix-turn-helix domain-containing protein n=1 Tax=Parabacteroides distasonis TaxID=823 RepID=A0A6I2P4M5_PARDI|nr:MULTISPECIES: helix-turn-helix transcriptional regulator [Bacteroidales]MCR1852409.1 helix-turn-helix transcriptional regulator [Parabacteroides distasonis]MRY83859.1 helix-turn-helix domain-containing protein [Parabacteroides distasonis]MRZ07153.1 helix-turn-helix domain-containing protein [Parabacteroides distasonis]RLT68859.1 XRE family transcriptional regulator [Parabacteroides sp. CH2-D42-20]GAY29881.1 XRE family transcriptional regulator [Prevotella sp. MGM2]